MRGRDAHCAWCGAAWAAGLGWPRTCAACGNTTFKNPLPVAVIVAPIDGGLLAVRRLVPPHVGRLALPGGYIDHGESWQAAAVRELREETGIELPASSVREYRVVSAPDGTLLVFGIVPALDPDALARCRPTDEASEVVVARDPDALAFPLHAEVARLALGGAR